MIVPGFIVSRIYKKGSLKNENGYYSFSFVNTIAKGKVTLTSPTSFALTSPLASLEFSSFPTLLIDGKEIDKKDVMMVIGDKELSRYDEREAQTRIGEEVDFLKGGEIITRVKGNLSDGKHNFSVTFVSKQFGSIILNFSDYVGERKVSTFERIINKIKNLFGIKTSLEVEMEEDKTLDTRKYIITNKKPDINFERLKTALFCKTPDRVPLAELGIDEEVKSAFLGKPINSMKEEVEFWLQAGYDYISHWALNVTPRKLEVIKSHKTTYKEEEQERGWVSETAGAITNWNEFEKYEWPTIDDAFFITFEEIGKYIPSDMKVIACVNGVFEPTSQAMGLETFCYSLVDDIKLVEMIFEKMGNLQMETVKRLMQFDFVGGLWIGDDFAYKTSTIISPQILRQYVFPWYKKFIECVKSKKWPVILHTDGNIWAVLDDIVECGFNAVHPLEPEAMDILEVKKKYQGKLCVMGNIDLGYTLTRGKIEEIEQEVKKKIKELAPGGGYCLGSSNSIPNYVPLENFIAMNRACLKFGRYPLK